MFMRSSAAESVGTGSTQLSGTYPELIIMITTRFGCIWKTRFRDFGINLSCRRYGALRQAEAEWAQGGAVGEICRGIGASETSFWRAEYGGLKVDQAGRLKELERENGRLKRAVAEPTLDQQILKGATHCPAPERERLVGPSH
jgi:hypothetical protein